MRQKDLNYILSVIKTKYNSIFRVKLLSIVEDFLEPCSFMSPVYPVFHTEVTVNITENRTRHARGPVQTSILLNLYSDLNFTLQVV